MQSDIVVEVVADRISDSESTVDSLISSITTEIIEPVNMLLSAAALVFFLWGVVEFIKKADSSGGRENGVNHMMWGLFGLALTISVDAFIDVIKNSFGL